MQTILVLLLVFQYTSTFVQKETVVFENLFKNEKTVGESYGSRIQKLEDSIVHKLDHPSNDTWKSIIEDMNTCKTIAGNFFVRLRLDDLEEINFALELVKKGFPQIVTRNYTQRNLSKMFNIGSQEVFTLYDSIIEFAKTWKHLRDKYFQDIYYNRGKVKSLLNKFKFERKLPQSIFMNYSHKNYTILNRK